MPGGPRVWGRLRDARLVHLPCTLPYSPAARTRKAGMQRLAAGLLGFAGRHTASPHPSVLLPLFCQVVGKKLEEAHRKQQLVLPPAMPPKLQQLVWDCTHWDPRQR